jgi:hypothetical protein
MIGEYFLLPRPAIDTHSNHFIKLIILVRKNNSIMGQTNFVWKGSSWVCGSLMCMSDSDHINPSVGNYCFKLSQKQLTIKHTDYLVFLIEPFALAQAWLCNACEIVFIMPESDLFFLSVSVLQTNVKLFF